VNAVSSGFQVDFLQVLKAVALEKEFHMKFTRPQFPYTLWITLFLALLVSLVCPQYGLAQNDTGSFSGTVKDQTGAVILQASVTATNVSTGSVSRTSSNAAGVYIFPSLPIGTYTISASHAGFSPITISGITLQVYQKAVIDIVMQVGGSEQTVTVQGSAPLVDPSTASLGTVVDEKSIQNLPLNLRQVGALALTVPGTIDTSGRSLTSMVGNGSGFNDNSYAGAGGYSGSNLLLIDGMVSRSMNNGAFALNPPPDFVKEFKIQNNIYDAAYGLTAGTVMNLTTQSGTNTIHGGAWEYLRNRVFDARNYFNTPDINPDKPEFTRNQFGASLGLPILKNKLFAFGAYEGLRLAEGSDWNSPVPTIAQKNGDFSGLLTGNMQNLCGEGDSHNLIYDTGQLFDPATEYMQNCDNGNSVLVGTPIPGNNIANYGSGLDSVALKVLALYPDPNSGGQFYLNEMPYRDSRNQWDARVDWNATKKDYIFGRYMMGSVDQVFPGALQMFTFIQYFKGHNVVGGWTHTFSPTLLNDLRIGYQKNYLDMSSEGVPRPPGTLASMGIAGLAADNPMFEEYPSIGFNNFAGWGDGTYNPDILPDATIKYSDMMTKVLKRHTLTFGFDFNFWNTKGMTAPYAPNGAFYFDGRFSALGGGSADASSASDLADLELGYPANAFYTKNPIVSNLTGGNWLAIFVQDNFRVSSNVTIEAGFRWDYRRQPIEENNAMAAFFPLSDQPLYQPGNALLISAFPDAQNDALCAQAYLQSATGQCLVATADKRRQLGFNKNQARQVSFGPGAGDFSPRLAISMRPTGSNKLILHVGGGIFTDLSLTNQLAGANANPITVVTPVYDTNFGAPPPQTGGIATTTEQVFMHSTTPTLAEVNAATQPSPFYHTPTLYEWSMSVQTQLADDWAIEAAYLGNRGVHLDFLHETGNQPKPGVTDMQERRPWPDFNQLRYDTWDGISNYHALTIKVTKAARHGLSGLIGYTYSKALDQNSGTSETLAAPQDDNNPRAEYGLADTSIRHRFTLSGIYELPFGKGRRFLGSGGPLVNALAGDWSLSSIITAQSGYPFTVTSANDFSNTGSWMPRPDRICKGVGKRSLDNWFDQSCFPTDALEAALNAGTPRFGNSGRNILFGPGLVDVDASLIKRFTIVDRLKTEFKAEFFNILNHPNFAQPDGTVGDGYTGMIYNTVGIGTTGYNRQIQLGLSAKF